MKTRTLTPYWGVDRTTPDYCPSGRTVNRTLCETGRTPEQIKEAYLVQDALPATYSVTVYPHTGEEVFESTKRKKPLMNNCYHSKVQALNVPYGYDAFRYNAIFNGTYYNQLYQYDHRRLSLPWPMALGDDLLHVSTEASGAARRAWWHMQPRFEGEVDMCNFLFELRDFKTLARYALRPIASYSKIASKLRRLRRDIARQKAQTGSVSRGAAGLYLTWELALKPLLSDLASIHAQLATLVRELQAEFKIAGSEDQSSHYSEPLGVVENLTTYSNNNYWYQLGTRRKTLFTATMHYQYAYEMRSTVDAIVKYWGLSPTPETFWNAIPFSFIVDYFIKIGDSIHAMTKDPNVDLRMHDYAESLLTTVRTGYIVKNDDRLCCLVLDGQLDDSGKNHDGALISGVQGTIYERRITRPNYGPALPRLKSPSMKQGMTMGAIVRCLF